MACSAPPSVLSGVASHSLEARASGEAAAMAAVVVPGFHKRFAKAEMRLGRIGAQLSGSAIRGRRRRQVAALAQRPAQAHPCLKKIGPKRRRPPERGNRLDKLPALLKDPSQIAPGLDEIGPQFDRFFESDDGLLKPPVRTQRVAQVVIRFRLRPQASAHLDR